MMLVIAPTMLLYSNAQINTTKQSDKQQKDLDTQGGSSGSTLAGGVAQGIFQNKALTLGKNIKNVMILIPNEGHESPSLPEEQRQINQPYVPKNIIVNPGTNIVWLNGDVGHEHTITMNDENSEKVFESGKFDYNTVSKPLVLNKTGKFTYSQADVNVDDPKFVMVGTVTVKDTTPALNNINSDTVGFFMIPSKDMDKHISELTDGGVQVLDKYTFKDLRGGQKGTGPNETLLLVGTKNGSNKLISTLQKIAPELPYS
jgi:plastocyanin